MRQIRLFVHQQGKQRNSALHVCLLFQGMGKNLKLIPAFHPLQANQVIEMREIAAPEYTVSLQISQGLQ